MKKVWREHVPLPPATADGELVARSDAAGSDRTAHTCPLHHGWTCSALAR